MNPATIVVDGSNRTLPRHGLLMTGTTTQIMIDLADMVHGLPVGETATRARLRRMGVAVASFAAGAGAAALLLAKVGSWCFLVPPLVALWTRLTAASVSMPASGTSPPPAPAR